MVVALSDNQRLLLYKSGSHVSYLFTLRDLWLKAKWTNQVNQININEAYYTR